MSHQNASVSQAFNIWLAGVDGERTETGRGSSALYAHFDAAFSAGNQIPPTSAYLTTKLR